MTISEKTQCENIIHTAALAAGATGISPIPGSDSVPLAAIQTTMILALSAVFKVTFTKECALNLAKQQMAEHIGKYAVSQFIGIIPGLGSIVKGGVAVAITETLGWEVAYYFGRMNERRIIT